MICPTPLGSVTVTRDTTGSLDFSVALAPDVNFHAEHSGGSGTGDAFWFDLSAGGTHNVCVRVPHVRNHRWGGLELGYSLLGRKFYSGSGRRLPWSVC